MGFLGEYFNNALERPEVFLDINISPNSWLNIKSTFEQPGPGKSFVLRTKCQVVSASETANGNCVMTTKTVSQVANKTKTKRCVSYKCDHANDLSTMGESAIERKAPEQRSHEYGRKTTD